MTRQTTARATVDSIMPKVSAQMRNCDVLALETALHVIGPEVTGPDASSTGTGEEVLVLARLAVAGPREPGESLADAQFRYIHLMRAIVAVCRRARFDLFTKDAFPKAANATAEDTLLRLDAEAARVDTAAHMLRQHVSGLDGISGRQAFPEINVLDAIWSYVIMTQGWRPEVLAARLSDAVASAGGTLPDEWELIVQDARRYVRGQIDLPPEPDPAEQPQPGEGTRS
jgi:hypothetical protein